MLQRIGNNANKVQTKQTNTDSTGTGGFISKLAGTVYGSTQIGLTGLLSGVRNLLPKNDDLPLTRIVDSLVMNREDQSYLYFDPKNKANKAQRKQRMNTPFRDAFVFVLGGGNYAEYRNLKEYARKNSEAMQNLNIAYGSTQIVPPQEFLQDLVSLGV